MAQRLITTKKVLRTFLPVVFIVGIFSLLISKHYEINQTDVRNFARSTHDAAIIKSAQAGLITPCKAGTDMTVFSSTVYVCNEPRDEMVYGDIYNLYPAAGDGRETIYGYIAEGDKDRADEMLEDIYNLERYEPNTFYPITWEEDPYGERYWRFIFYSLRPLRHLLATAQETGAERYYAKTREILDSFLTNGMDKEHSWDDAHGVAYRTMILTYAWWQLREAGELNNELSEKILSALEEHGDFLMDPENYEDDHNHAVTQSAALLVLAESFPDLANSIAWRKTAIRRINIGLTGIVDPNGVLNENSPFYQFYVLDKYWQIKQYADNYSVTISENFDDTIDKMVGFATYVLRPDVSVPLLGASTPRTVLRSGPYAHMAEQYDTFDYALTQGDQGDAPEKINVLYPSSGFAIFRSGWGEDRSFAEETYLIFDTGPYRTDHSDLDTGTFSLFGGGVPLIRDTGLFTYETQNPYYDYFHGTRGHNTVMVDGIDQAPGLAERSTLSEGEGFAWMTVSHELNAGVEHARSILYLNPNALLIVDNLDGQQRHTYEQLFHLTPEAKLETESPELVTATIPSEFGEVTLMIKQLTVPEQLQTWVGEDSPIRGRCATAYEEQTPCPELSFSTNATNTQYVTLVQFTREGEDLPEYRANYSASESQLLLESDTDSYVVDITFPEERVFDSSMIDLAVERRETTGNNNVTLRRVHDFFANLF